MKVARGTARKIKRAAMKAAGKLKSGNEGATRFRMAEAVYRRQKNRFFSGVVGSWQSPWDTGKDGIAFCDSSFARARSEYEAALAGLSQEQVWRYVDGLDTSGVKALATEARRKRAAEILELEVTP